MHLLDLARWFFGEFSTCQAMLAHFYWPIAPLEDNAFATLRTAQGQVVQLHVSWTEWHNLFRFELYGRDGHAVAGGLGGSYGVETATLGRRDFDAPFSSTTIEYRGEDASWRKQWEEFSAAAGSGREPWPGVAESVGNLVLAERLYAEGGQAEREQAAR
jgi:predicted dehydrogenase